METINHINQWHENNLNVKGLEPLSPVKPSCLSIDLFELVKSKSISASSHVSTYDTSSTRTLDDCNKSIISETIFAKSPIHAHEEPECLDDKMTLKEIISRRCHKKKGVNIEKKPKENTKATKTSNKRKMEREESVAEEKITKKEKLNNSESLVLPPLTEEKILAPKIVIKNGKVQIDDSPLQNKEIGKASLEVVVDKKKLTTSNSFKNINHSEKWTEEETKKFYRALELFGTDFSLITRLFPNRNRNQIKNKFLKEEKVSKNRIDSVFQHQNSLKTKKIFKKAHNFLQNVSQQAIENESNKLGLITTEQSHIQTEITKLRSDSFHSTSSVDSLDMAIIEDLSDMLKQKPF